jgi:hypothetical protein
MAEFSHRPNTCTMAHFSSRTAIAAVVGATALGALVAGAALKLNGLEQASWVAAVITVPLTIVTVLLTIARPTDGSPSTQNEPQAQETATPNKQPTQSITQTNRSGPNTIQLGENNIVVNLDSRTSKSSTPKRHKS